MPTNTLNRSKYIVNAKFQSKIEIHFLLGVNSPSASYMRKVLVFYARRRRSRKTPISR